MKQIQRVYEKKTSSGYVPGDCPVWTDPVQVEHSLLEDMIAKHHWKAPYVRSITRHNNYDGTCDYTVVYQDDGKIYGRSIYTIQEH